MTSKQEAPTPVAHGCDHLTAGCCVGRPFCGHGVVCTHGTCCHACWREKCPENAIDAAETSTLHELCRRVRDARRVVCERARWYVNDGTQNLRDLESLAAGIAELDAAEAALKKEVPF